MCPVILTKESERKRKREQFDDIMANASPMKVRGTGKNTSVRTRVSEIQKSYDKFFCDIALAG